MLHSYYYTLLRHVHTRGGMLMRPLFYEFPHDPATYSIDRQFMIGPALLVTPVLAPGQGIVSGYGLSGIECFMGDSCLAPQKLNPNPRGVGEGTRIAWSSSCVERGTISVDSAGE